MYKHKWSDEDVLFLRNNWPEKGSKDVARTINRQWKAVQRKAGRLGLKCDWKAKLIRQGNDLANKNKSCDVDYFLTEWSSNKAYILGYIFADGHISKNHYSLDFRCHSKDEEILIAIHEELKSNHKILRKPACRSGGRNNGPQTYFNVASKNLVKSLIERFGLCSNKSSTDLWMPDVPDEFFGHFLRGYFDGDGCISIKTRYQRGEFNLVGTPRFIRQIRGRIWRMVGTRRPKIQKYKGLLRAISWASRKDLMLLHNLIYPKGEYIKLKRKKMIFDVIVDRIKV